MQPSTTPAASSSIRAAAADPQFAQRPQHSTGAPILGRDTPDTFSERDSPGLSGINWDKWDSATFQGSTGADETARSGGRGLPSTTSRMAATASGERPFLTGAWPAPGAALAAARSRSRRSLSVPSMRLIASARRASSSVDTGSSRRLRWARAESVSVRRVSIRMSPARTHATISSMVAPSSIAAATASWIAAGSGSSDEPPPIAPAVLCVLSHCVARIRAREDDRPIAQFWRGRSAPCTAP